jgi:thioredoxin-dependent peroxiredoxin
MTHLKPGDKAPKFHLMDQNRGGWSLDDLAGHWAVIFFYPQADTPGCVKEACGFRDQWSRYEERDVKVLGVSADEYFEQSKFVDKYDLPLTLLADPSREMIEAYGVEKSWEHEGTVYWGAKRVTFVVDPEGTIQKVYEDVHPEQHAEEILSDLDGLQKTA